MEEKGGCCIARYAGGGYDASKVDRIMLRFRPIAPKPACVSVPGGGGGGVGVVSDTSVRKESVAGRVRAKRKLGVNRRCRKKRVKDVNKWPEEEMVSGGIAGIVSSAIVSGKKSRASVSDEEVASVSSELVTLPLLPENPDWKNSPVSSYSADSPVSGCCSDLALTNRLSGNANNLVLFKPAAGGGNQNVVMPQPVRPVGSSITVECITDTFMDRTGEDALEIDTWPGFVTDAWNRVRWTNGAYRRLVGQPEINRLPLFPARECGFPGEMVALWTKEKLPENCPAFSCRVTLKWVNGKEKNSSTVPCDVWSLGGGGFAWRLDVKAALSLGR